MREIIATALCCSVERTSGSEEERLLPDHSGNVCGQLSVCADLPSMLAPLRLARGDRKGLVPDLKSSRDQRRIWPHVQLLCQVNIPSPKHQLTRALPGQAELMEQPVSTVEDRSLGQAPPGRFQ